MLRVELHNACAEEWEYITGASLTAKVSLAVWIELWERSTIIPRRFISSTTVCERKLDETWSDLSNKKDQNTSSVYKMLQHQSYNTKTNNKIWVLKGKHFPLERKMFIASRTINHVMVFEWEIKVITKLKKYEFIIMRNPQ